MALSENRRTQLDGIVGQMVKNGESDANIRFVVNDFKSKYANESTQAAPKGISFGGSMDFLHSASDSMRNNWSDFVKGQIQGAATTAINIGELGSQALQSGYNATIGKLTGKNAIQTAPATQQIKKDYLTPTTVAGKIGFGTEKVAEAITPFGGAAKGERVANMVGNGIRVGKNVLPYVQATGRIAGQTAEAGLLGAAQSGNLEEGKKQAVLGGIFSGASEVAAPVLNKVLPKIGSWLEKTNLRLTPTQQRDLGTKIDDAVSFINSKGITGSPEKRLEKINELYSKQEEVLQSFLKNDAKSVMIDRQKIIDEAQSLKKLFENDRDALAIEKQIDQFVELIKSKYKKQIPVHRLNELKRSTYGNAYNNAGTKVRDDVEHGIGDILRKNIENSTQGFKVNGMDIGDFNKEYGNIITARNLIKASQGRKQIGFVGQLVSSATGGYAGSLIGGPVGFAIGGALGNPIAQGVAGTAVRSNLASIFDKGRNAPISSVMNTIPKLYGAFKQMTNSSQ